MENILHMIFAMPPVMLRRFRVFITYISLLFFIALATIASVSVKHFVRDSMSITLTESSNLPITQTENATIIENDLPEESLITIKVKKGDTLKTILKSQSLPNNEIQQLIKIAEDLKLSSSLKIGQEISFEYEINITETENSDLTSESRTLKTMTIALDKINTVEITRDNDSFVAKTTAIALDKFVSKASKVIDSSFIGTLKKLGLSTNSIIEITNAYSYQIDFQRQIQPGDTVTVLTEKFTKKDGTFSHYGKVLYASLNLSGKEYNIYRYSHDNSANNQLFFSEDGKSVRRSLLRTPVNIVRISSHYGHRKHPTLGYTKLHKGIDFSAPSGTPIYSAGDGVVAEIGWKSGFGKLVRIKHSPTLSTIYAHASNFAKNLKVGSSVKQGQIIAYVGQTGRATGPHLHYEVKIDGKNVNPMSIKTTPGTELSGPQLAKFQKFKNEIRSLNTKLSNGVELAVNNEQ